MSALSEKEIYKISTCKTRGERKPPQRNLRGSCQRFRKKSLEKLKLRKIYEFQEGKNN